MERKICRHHGRPQRRNVRALRQPLEELLLQSFRLLGLLRRGREHVFIDEALFRQHAAKTKDVVLHAVARSGIARHPKEVQANGRE